MPELPEVETIRVGLSKKITGLKIISVEILNSGSFQGEKSYLVGNKIIHIWRKAKVLGLDLSNSYSLIFHLKMSGQLIWVKKARLGVKREERSGGGHPTQDMLQRMLIKSTRIIFRFSDGSKLFFNDQRKFGWAKLVKTSDLKKINYGLKTVIGPEPLSKNFTIAQLRDNLMRHKNMAIKVALLDQSVVAGIGNIYASEACFLAGINPAKKVETLKQGEFIKLHQAIIDVLRDGIKYGGSSSRLYVNSQGERGSFLNHAFVYERENKQCRICNTAIKKTRLGGRGTYYCSSCQKP